jgi:hypothetical protein
MHGRFVEASAVAMKRLIVTRVVQAPNTVTPKAIESVASHGDWSPAPGACNCKMILLLSVKRFQETLLCPEGLLMGQVQQVCNSGLLQ